MAGQLSRLDLALLNELEYLPFARLNGQLWLRLISNLHERNSVVNTTNLGFGDPAPHFVGDALRKITNFPDMPVT